jgi:membrane-associated protease RseP (regulator of RpoE activity)
MRAVPSFDNKANKLRGFRVYPGRNRTAFASLGLRPGDLVTAINGTPLDDPQRGQEIFNTIQSSATAAVTVERGGQNVDLTLNVSQVLNEAARDLSSVPPAATPPVPPNNGLAGQQITTPEPAAGPETATPAPAPIMQPTAEPPPATDPATTNL